MKYLKKYKLFESIGNDLPDILLEINDENYWKADCWSESQTGKWVVIIKTVDGDDEEYVKSHKPLPIVVETIERAIGFMNGEGFTNYQITFDNEKDDQYEEITLEEVSDLYVWSNNFIRIEFWK